jgi:hypothetical protein
MFPLHRTKAWQEHQRNEREFLAANPLDGLAHMEQTLEEMNRELYRNLGLEYPGTP